MRFTKLTGLLGCILAVSGCAGSETQLRMLEHDNALRIEPVSGKPYDYVVRLTNIIDFGYDADNPATRADTALRTMKAQCPNARIVGEDVIEKGSSIVGRGVRDYLIHIRCDGADVMAVQVPPPAKRK